MAFAMCSSVRKLGFATQHAKLLIPPGWYSGAKSFDKSAVVDNARVDLFAVVEIVRKRGVHVSQCQAVLSRDFIDTFTESLVPDRNVLHRDATAPDTRLLTCRAGRQLYVVVQCPARHTSILATSRPKP